MGEVKNMPAIDASVDDVDEGNGKFNPNQASDAPRGGRAVLNRIAKESATVPFISAQPSVRSLRDIGYLPARLWRSDPHEQHIKPMVPEIAAPGGT